MNLKQKLDSFRLDEKKNVSVHFNRIQEIYDELAVYGEGIKDSALV